MAHFDIVLRLAVACSSLLIFYRIWDLDWWDPLLALLAVGAVSRLAHIVPVGISLWLLVESFVAAGGLDGLQPREIIISLLPLLLIPIVRGFVRTGIEVAAKVLLHRAVWVAVSGYLIWQGHGDDWFAWLAVVFWLWSLLVLILYLSGRWGPEEEAVDYET